MPHLPHLKLLRDAVARARAGETVTVTVGGVTYLVRPTAGEVGSAAVRIVSRPLPVLPQYGNTGQRGEE